METLEKTSVWHNLVQHQVEAANLHMKDLFAQEPGRFARYSFRFDDILFDFSKNRVTEKTLSLLLDLVQQSGLKQRIHDMFSGQKINNTEDRAVLHVALTEYQREHNYLFSALMVTDVTRQCSLLLVAGAKKFVERIDYPKAEPGIFELREVVSRKKQLLPYLTHCLQRMRDAE